jgi:hypothetical protein
MASGEKWSGGPGRLGVGVALGQVQLGLGCTVDVGWAQFTIFQYPSIFQIRPNAPGLKMQNTAFLLPKILQTWHSDT